jgi:hypothetical protein
MTRHARPAATRPAAKTSSPAGRDAAGLLAVGLTRHHGQGIALIGAVLLAWAAFDALSGVRRAGDGDDQ